MSRQSGWSLLLVLSVTMLGVGAAQADLGPFPARRPPGPENCKTTLIRSVDRAHVERGRKPRLVVRGTVPTGGWRDAALRFRTITERGTRRATAVYEFIGCQPPIAADVISSVTADLDLRTALLGGAAHRILIKAETNSTLLDLDARPGH